jgi:hypothetical protein
MTFWMRLILTDKNNDFYQIFTKYFRFDGQNGRNIKRISHDKSISSKATL